MMVSRIMLSLREAADSPQGFWSLVAPSTTITDLQSIQFFRPSKGMHGKRDDVPLDTFSMP